MQFHGTHKICQRCVKLLHKSGIKASSISRSRDWKSKDVRKTFLEFFCDKHDHRFVPSSSVIPKKGEGTYFTNAGMNQFKPIFLGNVPAGSDLATYRRVANSQKCVRVGGKHNDLDDVGQDLTHHTFFEMMGSWSFGDYFKFFTNKPPGITIGVSNSLDPDQDRRSDGLHLGSNCLQKAIGRRQNSPLACKELNQKEACSMALELLRDVYRLPLEQLYFTYFGGSEELGLKEDTECREIWRELGVPVSHILPFGMKDNFWDMGEVGPCGPCTEIHYDHVGGRDASHMVNADHPEVVEIWNLVFMQFERQTDQSLRNLPCQHVDTGMGLERMCAVLQGTRSNYDTDLFTPLFHWLHKMSGAPAYKGQVGAADAGGIDKAYRIIGDHSRMFSVCIADGLLPARVGIEQKLRSLMHRSFQQYENILKGQPDTLVGLIPLVAESLGEAYPEISNNVSKIQEVYSQTEHKYINMIRSGRKQFSKFLKHQGNMKVLSGEQIRALHEGHFGRTMSLDAIEVIAEAHGISLDIDNFHQLISQEKMMPFLDQHNISQVEMSQTFIADLHRSGVSPTNDAYKYHYTSTQDGYSFDGCDAVVTAIIADNTIVTEARENDKVAVILDKSHFYSESGGQIGDRGIIRTKTGTVEVSDTQSTHDYVLHHGVVTQGIITTSQEAEISIQEDHRLGCMRNHTATHLVNAALRQVLGDVKQRGSFVGSEKLSFDFSCVKSVSNKELKKIEDLVCHMIRRSLPVERTTLPLDDALSLDGVVYLENEAYPSEVHVLSVSDSSDTDNVCHSVELCGGTHVHNAADIGHFCISNFSGVAQGIKGIVCLTGEHAQQAIETGVKLQSVYDTLEKAVKHTTDVHQWSVWKNEINVMIKDDSMPKLVRDEVRDKMTQLGTEISTKQNQLQVELLKKELNEDMTDCTLPYILRQASMKTLKNATKLLEGLDIRKPVVLVVKYINAVGILIAVPEGCEAVRSLLRQEFETQPGVNIEDKKTVMTIKLKQRDSAIAINTCEQVLNSFVKQRVQTEL